MNAADELPPFGSAERIGLDRALSALEVLAEIWAAEIDLRAWAKNVAKAPPEKWTDAIYAVAIQCFIEGAYRHHFAVNDGECPHASSPVGSGEAVTEEMVRAAQLAEIHWSDHYSAQGALIAPEVMVQHMLEAALAHRLTAKPDQRGNDAGVGEAG